MDPPWRKWYTSKVKISCESRGSKSHSSQNESFLGADFLFASPHLWGRKVKDCQRDWRRYLAELRKRSKGATPWWVQEWRLLRTMLITRANNKALWLRHGRQEHKQGHSPSPPWSGALPPRTLGSIYKDKRNKWDGLKETAPGCLKWRPRLRKPHVDYRWCCSYSLDGSLPACADCYLFGKGSDGTESREKYCTYLNRFQQQLVIKTQRDHVSWEAEAYRMRVQTASHEHHTDLWSGAGAVYRETALTISPVTENRPEAARSARTAQSPLTAAGLTLMHHQCSADCFLTFPSTHLAQTCERVCSSRTHASLSLCRPCKLCLFAAV